MRCYSALKKKMKDHALKRPWKDLKCILLSERSQSEKASCCVIPSVSVQFNSVAQSCPTLCDPMNCSTPGLPVHHQLPEFTQTHVHRVSDAIQPSHPSSVVPFSSCPQFLPASESFPMSQRLAWGGQSTCKTQKYGKLKRSIAARSWGKGRNRGSQRIFRPHRVFHMMHYWWIFATCLSKHIECTSSVKPNVNYRLWVIVMGSLIVINIQYIK